MTDQIEDRTRLETQIKALRDLLQNAVCPTCHQSLLQERRSALGTELGTIESKLRSIGTSRDALVRISAELEDVRRLVSFPIADRLKTIRKELTRLSVEQVQLENEAELKQKEIEGFDTAEIARKRALRDGLLGEEARLAYDIEDRARRIEDNKRELAVIARRMEQLPGARASRSTAMVNVCLALERVFAESIERLRDDLRKHVEAKATEAFLKLTTQKAYQKLEINKNYGLSIVDERGNKVTVRSAGAEQIVALSLIDGLSRTGRAAGPVVMDTPFGRLDLKHRDNILRYLPTACSQLVLLVHSGEIRRETDLIPISGLVGAQYQIVEVNPRHSRIERVTG